MLSGPMPPSNVRGFASRGHSPATSVGFASRGHSPSTSVGRGGHFAGLFVFFFFLVRQEGRGKRRGRRARPPRRKHREKPRHACTRQAFAAGRPLPHGSPARQRKRALLLKMGRAEVPLPVAVPSSPKIPAVNGGSSAATAAPAAESKPKKKICCACPDTKRLRDECIVEHGESACTKWIEAHKRCLRA